jgi:hypothetical protein
MKSSSSSLPLLLTLEVQGWTLLPLLKLSLFEQLFSVLLFVLPINSVLKTHCFFVTYGNRDLASFLGKNSVSVFCNTPNLMKAGARRDGKVDGGSGCIHGLLPGSVVQVLNDQTDADWHRCCKRMNH